MWVWLWLLCQTPDDPLSKNWYISVVEIFLSYYFNNFLPFMFQCLLFVLLKNFHIYLHIYHMCMLETLQINTSQMYIWKRWKNENQQRLHVCTCIHYLKIHIYLVEFSDNIFLRIFAFYSCEFLPKNGPIVGCQSI